jgi:class 3 adenylate cyclase
MRHLGGTVPVPPQPTLTEAKPQDTAERRQVTVMFSDLVGSTALSARMDPEDLREIISAYQKCVAGTVQRFGGFVAKYMGDGALIYFGYPHAHEDDAERAVRAGLELIHAVDGFKSSTSLQTRVGIATGLVVVGDLIGSGAAQEQTVVGETPNLAARLQGIAEPNTVVIAESTRKLVGVSSSYRTSARKNSRASAGRYGLGRHSGQAQSKAVLLRTLAAAEKVARYRHAQLSAVRLSGDLNARPENVNLEELLASIKAEWTKLGPLIGLEVVPQGSRTEGGMTMGSRAIEHGSRSGV